MTLRVASEQSERDMRVNRAREDLDFPLRELTANLMRISRGAGKPYEIGRQIAACLNLFEKYREAAGAYPASELIAEILSFNDGYAELAGRVSEADMERWEVDGSIDRMHALHKIKRGALQVVASHMVGQRTQEHQGEAELHEGIRELEKARKERVAKTHGA